MYSGEEPVEQVAESELSRSQMEDPYYLGLIQFHESGTLPSSQDLSK